MTGRRFRAEGKTSTPPRLLGGGFITPYGWRRNGMREIGQVPVPTGDAEGVTFPSMRLAETKERVDITLDERMLSVQGRRQGSLDIRLNAIHTVKHHSSQLVPGWMVFFGLCSLWIGYRVMVPPLYRLGFMGVGTAMVLARFVTKQPTLTVQTLSGDTHVVFGNERALNRLSFMFHQLANGKSMSEVKAMMEAIEANMGHGQLEPEHSEIPSAPVALHTPVAVDAFLASAGEELEPSLEPVVEVEPDWTPVQEPEPVAPSPQTGFFPTYLATHAAAIVGSNPDDHRPKPVNGHVLLPVATPPMHQPSSLPLHGAGPFIPTWLGPDSGEVTPPLPDIDEGEEPILEAEQVEEALENLVPDEETPSPHTGGPPRPQEPLFTPRRPRELNDTVFVPRQARALHRRRPGRSLLRNVRQRSQNMLDRMRPARSPSPYGTSDTSSALRANAEAARQEPTNVLDALSTEHGGALAPEQAARLSQRAEAIQAAANEIAQGSQAGLGSLSFEDLQPSKAVDDIDGLPRLDED